MTAKFRRVQGDINDTIITQLTGVSSFTGATAVAHVWLGSAAATTLTATVVNGTVTIPVPGFPIGSPCGVCTVNLGGVSGWLATAAPSNVWRIEYEITFLDGSKLTWPGGAPDTIEVRQQGA